MSKWANQDIILRRYERDKNWLSVEDTSSMTATGKEAP